jgi:DNA-binding transcriptional regulator YhcF (GntR family)
MSRIVSTWNGPFPRERVPSIRNLSREMQVSINTVKEAYGYLEDRRVIEAKPQSGYYVCARLPDVPPDPDLSA